MGEVYWAKDTKLNGDAALKVLLDLFADDPERLARFGLQDAIEGTLPAPGHDAQHDPACNTDRTDDQGRVTPFIEPRGPAGAETHDALN